MKIEDLRDEFAGKAMKPFLKHLLGARVDDEGIKYLAEMSYSVAQAMITEKRRLTKYEASSGSRLTANSAFSDVCKPNEEVCKCKEIIKEK